MKQRCETIMGGTAILEHKPEHIVIFFDGDGTATGVNIQARPHVFQNGKHVCPGGDSFAIRKTAFELSNRVLGAGLSDPVTGADLSRVSFGGVIALLKAAFPGVYDDHRATVFPDIPAWGDPNAPDTLTGKTAEETAADNLPDTAKLVELPADDSTETTEE